VFDALKQELRRCAGGQSGVATINATVFAPGRVGYAMVDGDFAGSPAGSCMARAVRRATFPAFRQAKLTVSYPVSL